MKNTKSIAITIILSNIIIVNNILLLILFELTRSNSILVAVWLSTPTNLTIIFFIAIFWNISSFKNIITHNNYCKQRRPLFKSIALKFASSIATVIVISYLSSLSYRVISLLLLLLILAVSLTLDIKFIMWARKTNAACKTEIDKLECIACTKYHYEKFVRSTGLSLLLSVLNFNYIFVYQINNTYIFIVLAIINLLIIFLSSSYIAKINTIIKVPSEKILFLNKTFCFTLSIAFMVSFSFVISFEIRLLILFVLGTSFLTFSVIKVFYPMTEYSNKMYLYLKSNNLV